MIGGGIHWTWADQSPDAAAQFDATVSISGDLDPQHAESAIYRYLSLFVLSKIRDDFIKDAFCSLADVYQWQMDSEKVIPFEPQVTHFGSLAVQQIERQPFQRHDR